jgi:hypothetical protein
MTAKRHKARRKHLQTSSTADPKRINSEAPAKIRPTTKRTLQGLGGRRVLLEGFGRQAPAFIAITAGSSPPIGAWLSPAELRRFVEAAKRILQ